ncbi:MAG: hypothetical protein IKB98_05830 [Clostridia bacterium]|nr:hypothetical protein [Clostridia bacterium]
MKKIGFVDYYISEWHANNYPGWIKNYCEKAGLDYQVCYAWAEKDVSLVDGKTTAEWCEKMNIEQCATVEELCKKSDNIIVLAPSDPDTHLRLASEVFKYADKKRVYIDKTFAPDYATAKQICDLAVKAGVDFFSTSALRYADEIKDDKNVNSTVTFGGGSNYDEYIIHQVEMIVKTMGVGASKIKVEESDGALVTDIEYADGRKAQMNWSSTYGFKAIVDGVEKQIESDFFANLMVKIVTFFEGNDADFSKTQTLEVMKIRENAILAKGELGVWKTIK